MDAVIKLLLSVMTRDNSYGAVLYEDKGKEKVRTMCDRGREIDKVEGK